MHNFNNSNNEFIQGYDRDSNEEVYVGEDADGYYLCQSNNPNKDNLYIYNVYDPNDVKVVTWKSRVDALEMSRPELENSLLWRVFLRQAEIAKKNHSTKAYDLAKDTKKLSSVYGRYRESSLRDYDKDDYGSYYPTSSYKWTPPPKSTGFIEKLNKSDTLVIHCEDRTTDMLSQIYEGKNWDVLRDGNIAKDELHKLLQSHSRIVCLGHGWTSGLINKQGGGLVISADEVPYLKDKRLFVIWCNAAKFFENHGIGKGQFITTNLPSESYESIAAGCGNISPQLMLENITYWSKLCADICETCLNGNGAAAVQKLREDYLQKYGNHPVTVYNALGSQLLGESKNLPKYVFRGKPLHPKDYPIPNFDEKAFLLNPVPQAKDCPTVSSDQNNQK